MSMEEQRFAPQEYTLADQASSQERAEFISKTYLHLFGAIMAFIAIEAVLLQTPLAEAFAGFVVTTRFGWLAILGGFMAVSWIANSWAHSSTSLGMQYAGLTLYVVAEAAIFLPIMYIAGQYDPSVIPTAGAVTLVTFGVLTGVVFATRVNFGFMGPFLAVSGIVALGFIVCSILFGFSLGIVFTCIMILFACGYILYYTSNVLHEYRIGQHVAAALALFAAVALLFWYVLQLFMSRD